MIIAMGGTKVAVLDPLDIAYTSGSVRLAADYPGTDCVPPSNVISLAVEVKHSFGGMRARALAGGEFQVDSSKQGRVEVFHTGRPLGLGEPATFPSLLGSPLVPGLPVDFASAVLEGLLDAASQVGLARGYLKLNRAAYDEAESSIRAFRYVSRLLVAAISAKLHGAELDSAIRDVIAVK